MGRGRKPGKILDNLVGLTKEESKQYRIFTNKKNYPDKHAGPPSSQEKDTFLILERKYRKAIRPIKSNASSAIGVIPSLKPEDIDRFTELEKRRRCSARFDKGPLTKLENEELNRLRERMADAEKKPKPSPRVSVSSSGSAPRTSALAPKASTPALVEVGNFDDTGYYKNVVPKLN